MGESGIMLVKTGINGKLNKNSMVFNDVENYTYIIERNIFKAETIEV